MSIGIKGFESCLVFFLTFLQNFPQSVKHQNSHSLYQYLSASNSVLSLTFKYQFGRIEILRGQKGSHSRTDKIFRSMLEWSCVCAFLKLELECLKTMLKALQNMKKQTISAITGRYFQFINYYLITFKFHHKNKSSRMMVLGFF